MNYRPALDDILHAVAAETKLDVADLIGPCREPWLVGPRHEAMRRARATGASLPEIGRAFRRNHTTVLHAIRKGTA